MTDQAHRFDRYYDSTGIRIDINGVTVFDVPATDFTSAVVPGRFGFTALSQVATFTSFAVEPLP